MMTASSSSPSSSPKSRRFMATPMKNMDYDQSFTSPMNQFNNNQSNPSINQSINQSISQSNCQSEDRWNVCIRVRPLDSSSPECMSILSNQAIEFPINQSINQSVKYENPSIHTFHRVFHPNDSQSTVMQSIGEPLVDSVLNGYNGCVLAYGQTGSGKSWTMNGSMANTENEGLIPRTIRALLDTGNQSMKYSSFHLSCSYVEVYNEEVYDLLAPNTDQSKNQSINHPAAKTDCSESSHTHRSIKQVSDALAYLNEGQTRRKTAATNKNAVSSRSHALFTLAIQLVDRESNQSKQARLTLVDLAGSECSEKAGTQGAALKEGSAINQSLLALKNVIFALVSQNAKSSNRAHVNYRDSKLTLLLQSCLSGQSRVTLVANLSSAHAALHETANTLRFTECAKNLKTRAIQQAQSASMSVPHLITALQTNRPFDPKMRQETLRHLKNVAEQDKHEHQESKRRKLDEEQMQIDQSNEMIELRCQLADRDAKLQHKSNMISELRSMVTSLTNQLTDSADMLDLFQSSANEDMQRREAISSQCMDVFQMLSSQSELTQSPSRNQRSDLSTIHLQSANRPVKPSLFGTPAKPTLSKQSSFSDENQPARLNTLMATSMVTQKPIQPTETDDGPLSSVAKILADNKAFLAAYQSKKAPVEFNQMYQSRTNSATQSPQRTVLQPLSHKYR